jgi:hypothetical protein
MTTEELYQPISSIFTTEEMKLLPELCEASAKRNEEWGRKANDSETAADDNLVASYYFHAEHLRELAEQLRADPIVEDMKEEWIAEELIKEINARMPLCKRERYEMYDVLAKKIVDLVY